MQSRKTAVRQRQIIQVVEAVIAEHGFYGAIHDLNTALHNLAEISLNDPDNRAKEREFYYWANAVEVACERHKPQPWEQRISKADAFRARGWGISLA